MPKNGELIFSLNKNEANHHFKRTSEMRDLKRGSELIGFHFNGLLGGEIGISHSAWNGGGYDNDGWHKVEYRSSHTLSLSSEFYYKKNLIIAPKFGVWYNSAKLKAFCFGVNALFLYQTSSQITQWVFRPEIGIILPQLGKERRDIYDDVYDLYYEWKIVYGYNLCYRITGENNLLQASQISIILYLSKDEPFFIDKKTY
jgi:hypothetical protein